MVSMGSTNKYIDAWRTLTCNHIQVAFSNSLRDCGQGGSDAVTEGTSRTLGMRDTAAVANLILSRAWILRVAFNLLAV